ncbi:hypothetical protein Leryth_011545 [Lithospermum erythrorhizon]|nr:hypothetical protein Leryth_011545 [Lithospermum erythrorhizon]
MRVQNQKLSEEASYAKELASAAAVELKNLAGEVTKVSLQNAKLEKELAARERNSSNANRKFSDRPKPGLRGRVTKNGSEINGVMHNDFDSWDLDPDDLKMELHARKQREVALEAALTEKDILEDEYRKKAEESKRRETSLENDLANMWILVAQLKSEAASAQQFKADDRHNVIIDNTDNMKSNETDAKGLLPKDVQVVDRAIPTSDMQKEEPLVARLKARIQEMKDKEQRHMGNGDTNSHVCKVCFESSATAMLLPCRHFCLCKSCSLACSECPICRTAITDRIFAFT